MSHIRWIAVSGLAVAILTGATFAGVAFAHAPRFHWDGQHHEGAPLAVEDAGRKAWSHYGSLSPGHAHAYRLQVPTPTELRLSVLVLPTEQRQLQATIKDPSGRTVPFRSVRQPIFEVFTQMRLVRVLSLHTPAEVAGDYVVQVETAGVPAGSQPVKYIFAVDGRERFGFLDLFKSPLWWLQAHLWAWR